MQLWTALHLRPRFKFQLRRRQPRPLRLEHPLLRTLSAFFWQPRTSAALSACACPSFLWHMLLMFHLFLHRRLPRPLRLQHPLLRTLSAFFWQPRTSAAPSACACPSFLWNMLLMLHLFLQRRQPRPLRLQHPLLRTLSAFFLQPRTSAVPSGCSCPSFLWNMFLHARRTLLAYSALQLSIRLSLLRPTLV